MGKSLFFYFFNIFNYFIQNCLTKFFTIYIIKTKFLNLSIWISFIILQMLDVKGEIMFSMLDLAIFDSIYTFIESIADTLQYEYLLYIVLGIFVFYAILIFIKTRFSYEVRAIRGFKKIIKYFLKKPFINESNLVEFNRKMKKLPYQLRDRWQYFMLNREGLPSDYMTLYHCVEQPIKTSSYKSTVILARAISRIVIVLSFALGLLVSSGDYLSITNFVSGALCALIFYVLSELYIIFLRGRFNILSVDLYEYYLVFTRNLDKASVSIPDYVDYELLFTNREIREGIPVLREYLEKKAVLEQAALEKAKYNLESREKFDFSKFGIDGSLVLERAMETSQDYINIRNKLKEEILKLEQEKDKDNENYVNAEKEAQKKLQTIKENLDRMQVLMEESASRIEQNYIKKQQAEEIKKRDQINKDLEDMKLKFGQEVQFLDAEIKKRQDEIDAGKNQVVESMNSEFETYVQKVYTSVKNKLEEDKADEFSLTKQELAQVKENIEKDAQELENKVVELELKDQQIETLKAENERMNGDLEKLGKAGRRGVKDLYKQNSEMQSKIKSLKDLLVSYKQQNNETVYFDANGDFVNFEDYKDKKGQYRELPKVYDLNGNYIDFSSYYDKYGNVLPGIENPPVLGNFLPTKEGVNNEESQDVVYYDADGNVVDFSKFYNPDGSFKEFPKVYDKDGNYYDFADYYDVYGNPLPEGETKQKEEVADQSVSEMPEEQPLVEAQEETLEEKPFEFEKEISDENIPETFIEEYEKPQEEIAENVEDKKVEDESNGIVYYDENGNVVDFEQFYNEDGTFKEFPKVYDKYGNYYDFANYYDKYGNPLNKVVEEDKDAESKEVVEESKDEAPKRGRGRPRKEKKEQEISDKPKRGRGRPPKSETGPVVHKRKISRIDDDMEKSKSISSGKGTGNKTTKRGRGRPRKTDSSNALDTLDSQIEEETQKLKKQQSELKSQISQTLSELQTTNTNESNLSELKKIVAKLKSQASEAKKNGLSKEEQQKINKSLAELLRAMAQKK